MAQQKKCDSILKCVEILAKEDFASFYLHFHEKARQFQRAKRFLLLTSRSSWVLIYH